MPEECLVIYGEAWFERDAKRRVEVLRRCCTEDIVFMDPTLGRLHDGRMKLITVWPGNDDFPVPYKHVPAGLLEGRAPGGRVQQPGAPPMNALGARFVPAREGIAYASGAFTIERLPTC